MQQITASSGCEACNWDCAVGCGEKTERGRKLQELLCRWSRSRPSVRSRSISSPIHLSSILDQRSAPLCCPLFLNCCSVAPPCTDLLHHKGVERPPHPFSAPSTTSAKSIFSPDTISLPLSHGVNTQGDFNFFWIFGKKDSSKLGPAGLLHCSGRSVLFGWLPSFPGCTRYQLGCAHHG